MYFDFPCLYKKNKDISKAENFPIKNDQIIIGILKC